MLFSEINYPSPSESLIADSEPDRNAHLAEMAAQIADKIRNPLTGIAQTIGLLREDMEDVLDAEKLQNIDACIKRIDNFIEGLYLLAKPVHPSFLTIDIVDFVAQVTRQYFLNRTESHSLELVDRQIFVDGDMVLLQQVLQNILDNAVEAIEDGGDIRVSVQLNRQQFHPLCRFVTVAIDDTGIGISAEMLPQLKQPFFSTKVDGRGLGLLLARNFLRYHGGTLEITPKPTRGTRVEIILPVLVRRSL